MKISVVVLDWLWVTTMASLALILFVFTSMPAMGMSLTVKQIIDPLRNARWVLWAM